MCRKQCPGGGTPIWRGRRIADHAVWRKTSQWIALERNLAAAVANDTEVANLFRESCQEVDWDDELDR